MYEHYMHTHTHTYIHNDVSYTGKQEKTTGHNDKQQTVTVISGNKFPRMIAQILQPNILTLLSNASNY
jgi:hypothetical protein